ncbi:MAG: hypothetical protein AAGK05_14110 [Pseudomonadota bacterium]
MIDHPPPNGLPVDSYVGGVEHQRWPLPQEEFAEEGTKYPATADVARPLRSMPQGAQLPVSFFCERNPSLKKLVLLLSLIHGKWVKIGELPFDAICVKKRKMTVAAQNANHRFHALKKQQKEPNSSSVFLKLGIQLNSQGVSAFQ